MQSRRNLKRDRVLFTSRRVPAVSFSKIKNEIAEIRLFERKLESVHLLQKSPKRPQSVISFPFKISNS